MHPIKRHFRMLPVLSDNSDNSGNIREENNKEIDYETIIESDDMPVPAAVSAARQGAGGR